MRFGVGRRGGRIEVNEWIFILINLCHVAYPGSMNALPIVVYDTLVVRRGGRITTSAPLDGQ